jgi:signal transduction histidine kinase
LRIRQVLTNLMSNAVKFTDDGTVTIAVLHGIDDIRVVVKDTGLGIAKESLDRIFEPFEQADASVQHTHGGTGLGLAISRQLVQEMGGELSAESTAGKGSTFVVAFPRSLAVHVNRMQA